MAPTYGGAFALARAADCIAAPSRGLPTLFAFTDPVRTPDLIALTEALPGGAGLVLRTFGRPDIEAQAQVIADIAVRKGLTLLVSADPALASRIGAHGVHWPNAKLSASSRTYPGLISTSAHSRAELKRAERVADLVFVSPVFASKSPSASRPLGVFRLAALIRGCAIPVFALGGIKPSTIKRLAYKGVSGVAAIEGLQGPAR